MDEVLRAGPGGVVDVPEAPLPGSAAVHTSPKSDATDSPVLHIAENARDAGCYTFVTEVWFVDEDHPGLTGAIRREADPRYVPLLCRRVYLSPAGTEITRTYYCIGRHIPFPTEDYKEAAIHLETVPRHFPFPTDSIHPLRILWAPWDTLDEDRKPHHPVEFNNNTPPEVIVIGPWLLEQMKALRKFFDTGIRIEEDRVTSLDFEVDKLRQILEVETKADAARVDVAREEARYRMRHNWPQMKDAIDHERWDAPPEAPPLFLDLGRKG